MDKPKMFGFQVKKPFTSPRMGKFLPGMQGIVLRRQDEAAFVQARDVFDEDGNFLEDWVSCDVIEIGTKEYGTWEIDTCSVPRTSSRLTSDELDHLDNPRCRHIALAISTFLSTLAKTRPECLSDEDYKRLGGESGSKIAWLTAKVVDGIDKAGLLRVMNDPKFTIKDIEGNSILNCESPAARLQAGLYFRRYAQSASRAYQTKEDCSLYVGQSTDLYNRAQFWKGKRNHKELIEESNSIQMRALCLMDMLIYTDYKFIIEQVFMSLFQTCRDHLSIDANDTRGTSHQKNARDLDNIATETARQSGWSGAVQRKSFWSDSYGSCTGLNYQSPLSEAPAYEAAVWLRTDGYMPDETGESVPVSNFIRETPKLMTTYPPSGASGKPSFIAFEIANDDGYKMRIARSLPKDGSDGLDWPAQDTYFDVTFEVRTDWKPHPYSWARLPLIGPFEDWDRANSWAVSIGWKDPSNNYRKKYLHCQTPHTMANKFSNGSIQPYRRGIEIIHWLFREKIPADKQHRWLQTPPMASVKVVRHGFIDQTITFESPRKIVSIAPISSRRKHPDVIKDEMMGRGPHGDFGLLHVGVTIEGIKQLKASGLKLGHKRTKCDTCMFFNRNNSYSACKETEDGSCENCSKLYGRPLCSWTTGVPTAAQANTAMAGNTYDLLESRNDTTNIRRRQALYGLKGWTDDSVVSTDPEVLHVDQGEDDEEDVEDIDFEKESMDNDRDGGWLEF